MWKIHEPWVKTSYQKQMFVLFLKHPIIEAESRTRNRHFTKSMRILTAKGRATASYGKLTWALRQLVRQICSSIMKSIKIKTLKNKINCFEWYVRTQPAHCTSSSLWFLSRMFYIHGKRFLKLARFVVENYSATIKLYYKNLFFY